MWTATGRPSTLHRAPVSDPHCSLANHSNHPKLLASQKAWPRQVCGHWPGDGRSTIVSRKMLSADDPACTVVVVQSHPYESGSDMRTRSSAAARRTVHCTDTFCRAERAHRRERGGEGEVERGEQRVHFARLLLQCVLRLATTRPRPGRQSFCSNCCEYRRKVATMKTVEMAIY